MLSQRTHYLRILPSEVRESSASRPIDLQESYDYCMGVFKENARSFHFASRYLNEDERLAFAALYGFCRMADDFADEMNLSLEERERELSVLDDIADRLAEGEVFNHPLFRAFGDTMVRYKIPVKYLHELIEGVRLDLTLKSVKTNEELDRYCYLVASTVGLMMCHIWGATSPETLDRAADLGIALQLTNILRDVEEDYGNGRIYIPEETRRKFRVRDEDFGRKEVSPNFRRMIQHEISRTRAICRLAEVGIEDLPPAGAFTVKVAARVYGAILDEIEKMDYDVFRKRAVVPKWKKLVIALRARREYRREVREQERIRRLSG
ncbi:MAG: phytoene/squalene synthase family protein [Candidatus Thorarchaeota archaeon]|nr:phytoene/squalene synthase family protein [Candidatus Thorarchaeota archaeon]